MPKNTLSAKPMKRHRTPIEGGGTLASGGTATTAAASSTTAPASLEIYDPGRKIAAGRNADRSFTDGSPEARGYGAG